jgi:gamma-glutamylcyclotransferase (GGCT)/AIG2-like uncharacterized protein YtfP
MRPFVTPYGSYAFYGTLRTGHDNHALYADDLTYLETVRLPGFVMYSLGEYPYAVRTGNAGDFIVAELFRIDNPATERIIYEMELEAGYILSEVDLASNKFGIYLFEMVGVYDNPVIPGDWDIFRKLAGF